jgi:hypothetical protein
MRNIILILTVKIFQQCFFNNEYNNILTVFLDRLNYVHSVENTLNRAEYVYYGKKKNCAIEDKLLKIY